MLKHVVFFRLKSDYSEEQKQVAINEIVDVLSKLPKKIEEIQYYEIGVNEAERSGGCEICLISGFENFDKLNSYRNNPEHIAAVERIKRHIEFSTYNDFTKPKLKFER